jgi:FAD/FMN-containing dehydrogenase
MLNDHSAGEPIMTDVITALRSACGDDAVLTGTDVSNRAAGIWRRDGIRAKALLRPRDTEAVSKALAICHARGQSVIAHGGLTGLVGSALTAPDDIVISLERMNRIEEINTVDRTMTVQAGVVLQTVQEQADAAGLMYPLDLGGRGSATIGGNISTNAGGNRVIRYGMTRDMVLGLEAVLADGTIVSSMNQMIKNNAGYDLKQLFIGAEGTLGVITAAVVKLFPRPRAQSTALVALGAARDALSLLALAQSRCGDRLTAFELISALCIDLVRKHMPRVQARFSTAYPQYVLLELSDTAGEGVGSIAEAMLSEAIEQGIALDAVLAASGEQAKGLWALREYISDAQAAEGPNVKHDISIPISRIADFIDACDERLARAFPGVRMVTFGHVGDGNLHYNAAHPAGADPDAFLARAGEINRVVHDCVHEFGGSISAEHGLGQYKRDEIRRYKSPIEMELMRVVKRAIDPLGIMNPGKVL